MKTLLLCLSLFLAGCAPKTLFLVETDSFIAKFYDSRCSSSKVLALTQRPGGPPLPDAVKDGEVVFKDKNLDKREFCYIVDADKSAAFVIDEEGSQGAISLKK